MEERKLFERFCGLLFTGREILREVFMDKYVGRKQTILKYFCSDVICKAVYKCADFEQSQLDLLYPPGGAPPAIEKFGLPLLCLLISILPIQEFKASDGDSAKSKDKGEPTWRDLVTQISGIRRKHYLDNEFDGKDETFYKDATNNLINIYKTLVKRLSPGHKFDELSQLLEREEKAHKETDIDGGTDKQIRKEKEEQYMKWAATKTLTVKLPKNPRPGQIIEIPIVDMKTYCRSRERIEKGSFGVLYKGAKINKEESKYLIKKLKLTDEHHEMTYYTELHHETLLHPHVIPIIGRAENIAKSPRVVYLVYPYMENGSVRDNILRENERKFLCEGHETNSKIWLRCMYQVANALDYLHKQGKHGLRGPIFHRDLTSFTILFNEDFNAKIFDFGKAVEAKHNASDATNIPSFGAKGYHPKKMDQTRYKASYDVYSFCMVILEILTGEVVKDENSFADYKKDSDHNRLLQDIESRAGKVPVGWGTTSKQIRDKLAQKAWEVIKMEGTETLEAMKTDGKETVEVQAADFVQIFKDARLESRNLYKKPKNTKSCVSCYINPTATLPLKGTDCKGHDTPCTMFCVYCMSDYHNELICPLHGPTRPPFGDHVYGVFVAGNHTKDLQHNLLYGNDLRDTAKIFIRDAKKLVKVLTSKFPLVLGVREEHLKVVRPQEPGKDGQMDKDMKNAFKEIDDFIGQELHKTNKDKLNDSLFIFYFTGHSSQKSVSKENSNQKNNSEEYVLYLGGMNETINDSTEWLKEMLHHKLRVDNVLVILDSCHAAEQNFTKTEGASKVSILQLSSCDKSQKSLCDNSRGSYFTHFLCQALAGDFVEDAEGDLQKLCQDCKTKTNISYNESPCGELHLNCSGHHRITLSDVKKYIRGHYELLNLQRDVKTNEENIGEIELAYYKPHKSSISISLEGAQNGEMYTFSEAPGSIVRLRKDITRYIEEKTIKCQIHDMLEFHKEIDRLTEDIKTKSKYLIKSTSQLVAIYETVKTDKEELTSLNDLWKIKPSFRSLVAKIRNNVKGLPNGPVKLCDINEEMAMTCQESYFNEKNLLGISQNNIQVLNTYDFKVKDALKEIEKLESEEKFAETKWLLNNLHQILDECKRTRVFDDKEDKLLKFRLYKTFSILEMK